MSENQPAYTNRLIREKSPYLLQHAHNPVDWYAWGEEAFSLAKENDKPIFLSIGYATCHWCHVMERESFENPKIAQMLNDNFINIKVDREELPEVDSLYMEFAQSMMEGSAGWPLNVVLTPDLEPFFAATYLPPHNAHGLMGLAELVSRIQEVWHSETRETVLSQATKIVEVFSSHAHSRGDAIPLKMTIDDTAVMLFKMADPVYGGIKGSPKFPIGYQINFLLRYSLRTKDSRALFLVERTLDMMHRGGIYDHLGGGFSRYSVDEKWLVPHFEKMLYDNAILANSYLEAWQTTKNPLYMQVCREVLNYILRDMTHPEGGFYSAEDADSEGHEGLFYTWTLGEIYRLLGADEAQVFCDFYGVTELGNFEGRNILHTRETLAEYASKKKIDQEQLGSQLAANRKVLFEARNARVHPFKDDKILTSWNGLMIHAFAAAAGALGDKRYLAVTERAARFIKLKLWENGHLKRRWRDGEGSHTAVLDDYAFLIRGVLTLFEITGHTEWLEWVLAMTQMLQEEFKAQEGAYYQTDGKSEHIILRRCHFSDGAEPSGNSIHCENLLRLYHLTQDEQYLNQVEDILKAVKSYLDNYPPGYCYHLINLQSYYDANVPLIVLALNAQEEGKAQILEHIYTNFIPDKAVIIRRHDDQNLFKLLPQVELQVPLAGRTTLYICSKGVCKKPISDLSDICAALDKL